MFWRGKVVFIISFFINKNCEWEKSMKKLILALSVVGILCLGVVQSQALVGMPDAVPGTHLIQPFFLVPIPGCGGTDNTLMTLTEVRGFGGAEWQPELRGKLHWTIFDRHSIEKANGTVPYTKYDVVVLNAETLVLGNCSVDQLKSLEVDLDEDSTTGNADGNEYYMGYITYVNNLEGADNFIGHMYVVDIPKGRASGAIIPAREYAPRGNDPLGAEEYWPMQNSSLISKWITPYTRPFPTFTDYEVFTAAALAYSKDREHSAQDADIELPTWFRLLPRYYLKDHTGETFFFIWTSGNWGKFFDDGNFDPDTYNVVINMYDEDEHVRSGSINLPYELNYINVRNTIPRSWLDTKLGGWFDICWDIECLNTWDPDWDFPWLYDAIPLAAEWLGYSYQFAYDLDLEVNWNALFPIHRDVDELVHIEDICEGWDNKK
jgi:hypothetical protein